MKTRSETLFEHFLAENHISYRPVPRSDLRTPDYCVPIDDVDTIFEVKEISGARYNALHSGVVGERVRQKINRSKRQMQAYSEDGKPTILLIFNNHDTLQLFGTENHDFKHAMYGEDTLRIDLATLDIVDRFCGLEAAMQMSKNTSISALGRLRGGDSNAPMTVTLFENLYAAVPLNYTSLPPCFEVIRFLRDYVSLGEGQGATQ